MSLKNISIIHFKKSTALLLILLLVFQFALSNRFSTELINKLELPAAGNSLLFSSSNNDIILFVPNKDSRIYKVTHEKQIAAPDNQFLDYRCSVNFNNPQSRELGTKQWSGKLVEYLSAPSIPRSPPALYI